MNQAVLSEAARLGLTLERDGGGRYVAYYGALVAQSYTKVPGFEPSRTVIDVGAQYGDYALLSAKKYGADVYAFEPLPANFATLERNILANHLQESIHAAHKAVGRKRGTTQLRHSGDLTRRAGDQTVTVDVVAIDDLQVSPSLLKVDVEGMEMEVLEGARSTVDRWSPKMIVETHSKVLRRCVDNFLGNLGYRCVFVDPIPRSQHEKWMDEQSNRFYLRDRASSERLASTQRSAD
ncbi:MAG: FkbM family methyltransferase [Euryarchaeota archaeon]|nr:FkbM family methyltransferase [Euryarchaeota archaeon]MDE1837518.1 FkbM family methyltransferase [Euryarchaeota archaeon]MDE2046495.1 FkbM family methyltransferase [Thermoplasmata archaeon]